jgi:hypothetical protein
MQASTKESNFRRLFSGSWGRSATVDNILKGLKCILFYPYNPSNNTDDELLPPAVTRKNIQSLKPILRQLWMK